MVELKFIPVKMRLPLKFGAETIESIQIAHRISGADAF